MSAEGKEMIDTLSKLDRIKDIRNRTIQVKKGRGERKVLRETCLRTPGRCTLRADLDTLIYAFRNLWRVDSRTDSLPNYVYCSMNICRDARQTDKAIQINTDIWKESKRQGNRRLKINNFHFLWKLAVGENEEQDPR